MVLLWSFSAFYRHIALLFFCPWQKQALILKKSRKLSGLIGKKIDLQQNPKAKFKQLLS